MKKELFRQFNLLLGVNRLVFEEGGQGKEVYRPGNRPVEIALGADDLAKRERARGRGALDDARRADRELGAKPVEAEEEGEMQYPYEFGRKGKLVEVVVRDGLLDDELMIILRTIDDRLDPNGPRIDWAEAALATLLRRFNIDPNQVVSLGQKLVRIGDTEEGKNVEGVTFKLVGKAPAVIARGGRHGRRR